MPSEQSEQSEKIIDKTVRPNMNVNNKVEMFHEQIVINFPEK